MINNWGCGLAGARSGALALFVIILLFVVAVTGIAAFAPRPGVTRAAPGTAPDTPEQILRARFARDEIDEAEFETRMATLRVRH
jgi:putative membrane protein